MIATTQRAAARSRRGSLALREEIAFFLFASPWLIGFLVWTIGPMVASLGLSFTDYAVIAPPHFTGLENYITMLTGDELVWQALRVTVLYAAGAIPLGLVASLILALLMNQKIIGIAGFRTIFYLPSVISGVPVALLWMWILNPDFGIINNVLARVGIHGSQWLFSETWVLPSLILMSLWTSVGALMVIYLAGLQGIPQHLYEAAELDGAGPWAKFVHVTIPMISPIIFFNALMGVIGSFQIFTPAYVMTKGGPANASLFFGLYLYNNAFKYFKMGYASALAWLMFLIILALTLLVIRSSPYWVYYEGKGEGGR